MNYLDDLLDDFLAEKITEIQEIDFKSMQSDGLISGKLGLIYFYLTLYKENSNVAFVHKIEGILTHILEKIENGSSDLQLNSSFSNGLSGLGFIITSLINENILDDDFRTQLENINELVFNSCVKAIENNDFDFINGSIGMLYYLNSAGATSYVEILIDKLYDIFIKNNLEFYNKNGVFEGIHFGYAHGLPAIVKVLDGINNNPKCEFIIKSIIGQQHKIITSEEIYLDEARYFLPRSIYKVDSSKMDFNWRPVLAWSNSDVNFSTLVYSIKNAYISSDITKAANSIAIESTKRQNSNHTMVSDYRFFFGSSGIAQMYSKLYAHTNIPALQEAYLFWLNKTFIFLNDPKIRVEEHPLDLINNLTGAVLSLNEYKHPSIKGWDKIFLL